jgi:hypothetical protein
MQSPLGEALAPYFRSSVQEVWRISGRSRMHASIDISLKLVVYLSGGFEENRRE